MFTRVVLHEVTIRRLEITKSTLQHLAGAVGNGVTLKPGGATGGVKIILKIVKTINQNNNITKKILILLHFYVSFSKYYYIIK